MLTLQGCVQPLGLRQPPPALSWHGTALTATKAKAPSIMHHGCEDAVDNHGGTWEHLPSNHSRLFCELWSSAPKSFLIKRRGRLWHQNQPHWRDSYTLKREDSFFQIRQKRGSNLPLCFCLAPVKPCEQPNPRATGCTRQGRFPSLYLSLPHFFWPEILSGPAKLFPWNSHKKL